MADSNRQANRVGFAAAEPLDKPDDPVGHSILFPQQGKDVFGEVWLDRSSFPVDPCALDSASCVTCGDTDSGIVADAHYLSPGGISANE